ncbi:MAG: hypothetical protein HRU38_09070 [Saccharospirillaceae bacterium]|nr:hypothetical protein [Pseudomonadales bacterium]NRB78805.1 hypothetical protein [Saccharospirillaceae bacterium]
MNNIATILIELLCFISVEPDGGLDLDETADLQIDAWQALIHDLEGSEKEMIKEAVKHKLTALQSLKITSPEQEQLIGILFAFIKDELQ